MSEPRKIEPVYAPMLIGKRGLSPHDDQAVELYPNLMQLVLPKYDEKQRLLREPGIISLKVDGSIFRVSLICPTEGLQTTLETPQLCDILENLELHVAAPNSVWTPTYDSKKRSGQSLKSVLES